MLKKWQQFPWFSGIILGFIGLPLLWMVQVSMLRLAAGNSVILPAEIFLVFKLGMLPGAILGAGLSKAIAEWLRGNPCAVKWNLLCYGGAVSSIMLLLFILIVARDSRLLSTHTFL